MTISAAEGARRLKILVAFMREHRATVAPHFSMGHWSQSEKEEILHLPPEPHCGTRGCLGGYACLVPEFRELGLTMTEASLNPVDKEKEVWIAGVRWGCYNGLFAVQNFFGLSYKQNNHVFLWG